MGWAESVGLGTPDPNHSFQIAPPPAQARVPAQLSLGNCQKGQLHVHASLGAGLHEGNAVFLRGWGWVGESILRTCFWPLLPFTQPY